MAQTSADLLDQFFDIIRFLESVHGEHEAVALFQVGLQRLGHFHQAWPRPGCSPHAPPSGFRRAATCRWGAWDRPEGDRRAGPVRRAAGETAASNNRNAPRNNLSFMVDLLLS